MARKRRTPTAEWAQWAKTRKRHLLTYPECRACGTTEDVVVHHLRYTGPRGHTEKPGDLVTMCRTHHDEYHRIYGKRGLIENTIAYCARVSQRAAEAAMVDEFLAELR